MLRITVVTPVKNGQRFIKDTVDSVLRQRGAFELEYVVRDGGSTDNTLDILGTFGDAITVVSENDEGPQDAINAGLFVATGDIGCWLNADDLLEPGALEQVAHIFAHNADVQWLYGRCRIVDRDGREIRRFVTLYKNLLGYRYSRWMLLCENFINQPAVFWRMNFLREVGRVSGIYQCAWDYDLWIRMAARAAPRHVRKYLASFRRHEQSISERAYEKQFAEERAIARPHSDLLQRAIHCFNYYKIITAYRLMQ